MLQSLVSWLAIVIPTVIFMLILGANIFMPIITQGADFRSLFFDHSDTIQLLSNMSQVVQWVMMSLIYPGMTVTALKQIRGEEINIGDLFSGFKYAWGYFVIALVMVLGFFGCCIGILFTGALFCLAVPLLVDRNWKIGKALSESYNATKNNMGFFMVYFIALYMMMVVVFVVLAIIMVVTKAFFLLILMIPLGLSLAPLLTIAQVVAYERTFNGFGGGTGIPMMQPGVPIPPPYMPTPGVPAVPQPPVEFEALPPPQPPVE